VFFFFFFNPVLVEAFVESEKDINIIEEG